VFRELEAKYKSEVHKFTGFALMSPFSIKITNIFIQEEFVFDFSFFQILSWFVVCILFIIGVLVIYRGLDVVEEYQDQRYSLKRSK